MKYLARISNWAFIPVVVFGAVFFFVSSEWGFQGNLRADPTDDFSFSFSHSPFSQVSTRMSEKRVAAILGDHLKNFPQSQIKPLARHLVKQCRKHRFDPAFVLSLIQVESSFRIQAVSPAGAIGLMQLMPPTAQFIARVKGLKYSGTQTLFDPFVNLSIGLAYLGFLRDRYSAFSPYFHIAAYNIGPAKMDELMSRKSFKPWKTKKYYEAILKGVPGWRYYGINHGA